MEKGLLKKKGPKQMEVKPTLALPEGLELVELERSDGVLTVTVVSIQRSACCPLCAVPANRVHSSYRRQVADLPCGGQPVRLLLQVHKYFCDECTCARKIFAERLTPFVEPWACMTKRLFQILQVIGLATGGRLGARVTDRLGIPTSRQTILRRIMALPTEPVGQVKAGLSLPTSNGQTEGQITRLKLLKRQGYGRANFQTLRKRVLYRAS